MNLLELARDHAESAYLRSCRSCHDIFCEQFTVEEEIFMCMFYIWAQEYGPGWERAVSDMVPIRVGEYEITESVCP